MYKLLILLVLFSCVKKECQNGAINYPGCNECPPGKKYLDNQCAILVAPPEIGK